MNKLGVVLLAILAFPLLEAVAGPSTPKKQLDGGGVSEDTQGNQAGSGSSDGKACLPPEDSGTDNCLSQAGNIGVHQGWKFFLRRASDSLDQAEKKLEEYGTVTMSSLLLAPAGGNFKFNIAITPQQFYGDAQKNIEGSAISRLDQSQTATLTASFQNTGAAPSTSSTASATASGTASTTAAAASVPLDGGGQIGTYSPILPGTPSDQTNLLPDRPSLITAAGDSATQSLLNFLGDPSAAAKFKDKVIFVGVTTVAVNPGWRSKKDFAAQITIQASYDFQPARRSLLEEIKATGSAAQAADDAVVSATNAAALEKYVAADLVVSESDSAMVAAKAALDKANLDEKTAESVATATTGQYAKQVAERDVAKAAYLQAKLDAANADAAAKIEPTPENQETAAAHDLERTDLGNAYQAALASVADSDPATTGTFLAAARNTAGQAEKAYEEASRNARNAKKNAINAFSKSKMNSGADAQDAVNAALAANFSDTTTAAAAASAADAKKKAAIAAATAITRLPKHLIQVAETTTEQMDSGVDFPPPDRPYDCVLADTGANPLIAGVSPMTDSQTLDLQDQFRRQDALTLQLAAALQKANLSGQAKFFEQYLQSRQKEAQTVSNSGVVNTFSASGGIFGFEIGPRLKALADPASRRGGSGNILDRQSFPALLIIGVDQQDILPTLACYSGTWRVVEPCIRFNQTSEWMPLTHEMFSWGDFYNPAQWHAPRFSENDRLDITVELSDAMNALRNFDHYFNHYFDAKRYSNPDAQGTDRFADYDSYEKAYNNLVQRAKLIRGFMISSYSDESLPIGLDIPDAAAAKVTTVDKITPSVLPVESNGDEVIKSPTGTFSKSVFLLGSNLDLASAVNVKTTTVDDQSDTSGFTISAAFADSAAITGSAPNANYREVTVTFVPNVSKKVPRFAMFNLELTLDPNQASATAAGPAKPVDSPTFALLRTEPDEGLHPVISSNIVKGPEGAEQQTISVDPSQSSNAIEIGGDAIDHNLDPRGGVPLPKQVNSIDINNSHR